MTRISHWADPIGQNRRTFIWLVVLLPLALHLPFLDNPWVFDDLGMSAATFGQYPETLTARWIFRLSLWLNAKATGGGLGIEGFRLVNVLLHAATALLVMFVVDQWIMASMPERPWQDNARRVSALGALVFSIHPVTAYGVGYLIQRSIVLATLFALIAIAFHTKAQRERRPAYLILAAAAFALSVLSKEHSVALPGFLAVMTYWLHRQGHRWSPSWTPIFLVYGSISVGIVHLTGVAPANVYEPHTAQLSEIPEFPYLASVLTQAVYFFRYLALWIVPWPGALSIDLHSSLPYRVIPWYGLAGAMAILAYSLLALNLLRRKDTLSIIGLGMSFSLVMFLTEFWAVRLSEAFVLYRSYLWMVFVPSMATLIVWLSMQRARTPPTAVTRAAVIAGACAVTILMAVTAERLYSMSSPLLVWKDAAEKNRDIQTPSLARVHLNLGNEYRRRGDLTSAEAAFNQALALNPRYGVVYQNLGHHYASQQDLKSALTYYDKAISVNDRDLSPRFARADILLRLDRRADALADYLYMLERMPGDPKLLNNIAAIRIHNGDLAGAIDLLEKAIGTHGVSDVAYFNLSLAHVRAGRLEAARNTLRDGAARYPDVPLLEAFAMYLSRDNISPMRWLPRIDPRDRAP